MQVLVAGDDIRSGVTRRRSWALEGELVRPPGPSCGDPACACGRRWTGLASARAAQTGVVAELHIEREGLLAAFIDALRNEGRLVDDEDEPDDELDWVSDLVDQHLDLAKAHAVATVIDLDDGRPVATFRRAS
jgi:hypothetical protein